MRTRVLTLYPHTSSKPPPAALTPPLIRSTSTVPRSALNHSLPHIPRNSCNSETMWRVNAKGTRNVGTSANGYCVSNSAFGLVWKTCVGPRVSHHSKRDGDDQVGHAEQ